MTQVIFFAGLFLCKPAMGLDLPIQYNTFPRPACI
jgi:hypothetical protein